MLRILLTTIALWFALVPAYAQPVEVASGVDLDAWQSLEQRRLAGEQAVDAYRGYVLAYTESPLAVMAWSRLLELGAAEGEWSQALPARAAVQQVRRRWQAHQHALADAQRDQPVVVEAVHISAAL